MDTLTAINKRRCVRSFSDRAPEEELISALLEAAIRAPSAGNLQPWHFYIVRDEAARKKLSAAALSQRHVAEAPVVFVVCAEADRSAGKYGQRGRELYCIQDTAAAAQNLLLAATAVGLSCCWVGAFEEREVARVLKAPVGRRPVVMIPVGYAAGARKGATGRMAVKEVTSWVG